MKRILFICTHNSGRSQMAEAFFNRISKGKALAISAGTKPAIQINPLVIEVMKEAGFDIGNQKPKLLTIEILKKADRIITMGCSAAEVCPASLVPTEDWELEDPQSKPISKTREIRDVIRIKVENLVAELL